jgi:3-hydroxyisobutyrate dehydrogenase-like beta-hydroxyacid dehydrogenase
MARVGFVGLGKMGLPMAVNILAAGHTLVIHSRSPAAIERLTVAGARAAGSVREIAADVDILCSCRVTPDQSREVFLGAGGAIGAGNRDLVCVDFSTIDPMTSREIAAALAAQGIGFLDAPVSGGPDGAAAKTLSVMVGGEEAVVARAAPVLQAVGRNVFHMGPVGAGVSTKLCNNMITGTLHVLLAEAMVLGVKSGIDPRRLYDVLRVSSARGNTLERVLPNHFLPRNYVAASAVTTIIKDLECIGATGKALGVRLLLPTIAQQCFVEAAGLGHGDKDLAAVILPMEEIAGIKIGPV